jgi:hypothetical protein
MRGTRTRESSADASSRDRLIRAGRSIAEGNQTCVARRALDSQTGWVALYLASAGSIDYFGIGIWIVWIQEVGAGAPDFRQLEPEARLGTPPGSPSGRCVILETSVGVPTYSWPVKACRDGWVAVGGARPAAVKLDRTYRPSSRLCSKRRLRTWRPIFETGCKPR